MSNGRMSSGAYRANRANRERQPVMKRRGFRPGIGGFVFALLLVYMVIKIVTAFNTTRMVGYQVKTGSLSSETRYDAIAIRDEEVFSTTYSGYVNLYAGEGQKVAVGNIVYTVDESGRLSTYVSDAEYGSNTMSEAGLAEAASEIASFNSYFDSAYFDTLYDFKYSINSTIHRLANDNIMAGIMELNSLGSSSLVNFGYAQTPGIVLYYVDGMEKLTADSLRPEHFDRGSYERTQVDNNDLVQTGDVIFKECVSEDWSIVIQVDDERAAQLEEMQYVKVKFLKNQVELTGKVTLHRYFAEGSSDIAGIFCELSFTNSMLTFCGDRFLDVELIMEENKGLKVPVSSIAEQPFFLVPKDFVVSDADDRTYVMKRSFTEDGNETTVMIYVFIRREDEEAGEYYLDEGTLNVGDVIYAPGEEQETFTVGKQGNLTGVFNINKGYAEFKQVEVLYSNDEYSIVKPNQVYGLRVYDFIALDASAVKDDDLVTSTYF